LYVDSGAEDTQRKRKRALRKSPTTPGFSLGSLSAGKGLERDE